MKWVSLDSLEMAIVPQLTLSRIDLSLMHWSGPNIKQSGPRLLEHYPYRLNLLTGPAQLQGNRPLAIDDFATVEYLTRFQHLTLCTLPAKQHARKDYEEKFSV
ncbi:hypothetical protein Fot_09111 [Forsythia ovata]|uniref:Uncharacterized protein n=1 Tax=Forsythia ovata TaxID=205694 RepID=A0ABD1WDF0_9LAMI